MLCLMAPKKSKPLGDAPPPAATSSTSRLLRPRELAAYLCVSPTTIRRELQEGLPYVRVRNQIRFVPEDVLNYLRKKTNS